MYLVIDNYDSFVHNLARYFELAGVDTRVVRNDEITIEGIKALKPEALILSPGPCAPNSAGICIKAVKELGAKLPVLGVCLGHQAIGEAYGAKTTRADPPVHGKASTIAHDGSGLFNGLPSPMDVGRYHSLHIELPEDSPLQITARTKDGEIMAIRHTLHPVYGVQFHPESVLTSHGQELVNNFVQIVSALHKNRKTAA